MTSTLSDRRSGCGSRRFRLTLASAGRFGRGFAFRLGLGLFPGRALRIAARVGRGSRFRTVARLGGLRLAAAEVGGVPAAALELKPCGGHLLDECCRMTGRAGGQRRIRELLQRLELVAALRAAVFVDRHGWSLSRTRRDDKGSRPIVQKRLIRKGKSYLKNAILRRGTQPIEPIEWLRTGSGGSSPAA